jgi:hypothetical protein
MAGGVGDRSGHFGGAISNMVADAVHKVIVMTLPHIHAARTDATKAVFDEATTKVLMGIGPLMRECLDADVVHPVLRPVFRMLAGKD